MNNMGSGFYNHSIMVEDTRISGVHWSDILANKWLCINNQRQWAMEKNIWNHPTASKQHTHVHMHLRLHVHTPILTSANTTPHTQKTVWGLKGFYLFPSPGLDLLLVPTGSSHSGDGRYISSAKDKGSKARSVIGGCDLTVNRKIGENEWVRSYGFSDTKYPVYSIW